MKTFIRLSWCVCEFSVLVNSRNFLKIRSSRWVPVPIFANFRNYRNSRDFREICSSRWDSLTGLLSILGELATFRSCFNSLNF